MTNNTNKHKFSNRLIKWAALLLLLFLAFGDKIKSFLEKCTCEDLTSEAGKDLNVVPGEINLPGGDLLGESKQIDVELFERSEDQNVQNIGDQELLKRFFPSTGTLDLTNMTYVQNNL